MTPEVPAQPRGQAKRALIVDAAAEVALARGVAGLSHRTVAAAAGVPLGSTTYYFRSLDDLRAAAVDRLLAGDHERRAAVLEAAPGRLATAEGLAWQLIDLAFGVGRLDEPAQVALFYERVAEAARAPALATVVRAGQLALEHDVGVLLAGTSWAHADPGAIVAIVDGRTIGWLALGDARPHLLTERVAADLAPWAGHGT